MEATLIIRIVAGALAVLGVGVISIPQKQEDHLVLFRFCATF